MDADRLGELEVERRFLLRSLADLEREHEAGDVDDTDYVTLRDGYTARAAATIREIERGSRPPAEGAGERHSWGRVAAWSGLALVVAIVAGVLLARSWGDRSSSDASPTGGVASDGTPSQLLAEARTVTASDPVRAIELFAQVQQIDPNNVEAITYGAWLTVRSALYADNDQFVEMTATSAVEDFDRAIAIDPAYPDPQCFAAIVRYRVLGDPAGAGPYLDACLAADPPQDVKALAEALRDAIDAELAGTTATTPPTT